MATNKKGERVTKAKKDSKSKAKAKPKADKKPRTDRRVPHAEKVVAMNPEQKQAFETYFLMGDDRSYRQLAKSLNKGVTTISNWAKKYDWQSLVEERDRQVDKVVEARNNKTMAEIKLEQARHIDAVLNVFWQEVEKGKYKLDNWADFDRLWKIRQELGNPGTTGQNNMFQQLSTAFANGVKALKEAEEEKDNADS